MYLNVALALGITLYFLHRRVRGYAPWVGDLPGDGEFAGAGEAEQVENGIFYGLNLVRIIEVIGTATGCA